jgi:hypothetical protein
MAQQSRSVIGWRQAAFATRIVANPGSPASRTGCVPYGNPGVIRPVFVSDQDMRGLWHL